jgi:hypothetical protein
VRLGLAAAVCLPVLAAMAREPGLLGGRDDFSWTELPAGRFRDQIGRLPDHARREAERRLREFSFPPEDVNSLHVDAGGAILYVDLFPHADGDDGVSVLSEPVTSEAAVPVSPFPDALKFHSRPGAPNVLFLDFDGHTVTGTAWNTTSGVNRASIPATSFSTDSDFLTYSDAEQNAIKRIWQRVAEDYAPFNIDVTTEAPATFNTRTARALITRNTDTNGLPNPASTAGGVAYVNVFGSSSYAYYSPAWIYANNLSHREDQIAEAASHEIGHNLGLSHDGKTDGTEYYGGHGTGETSWGPIMGVGYNRNVSQWSKGEYYLANNPEDDLAIIATKLAYRTDDAGGTPVSAAYLTVTTNGAILATTPETDPDNLSPANKGVIERSTDVDVFALMADAGPVVIAALPWRSPTNTFGGNLDIQMRLLDASGAAIATQNPATATSAILSTNLPAGQYYVEVRGVAAGSPTNASPSGYTVYGVLGQYFITGSVVRSTAVIPPQAALSATNLTQPGQTQHTFAVTYSDNAAISAATIGTGDTRVLGPNGYDRIGTLTGVNAAGDGTPRIATYAITPPGAEWTDTDAGVYVVHMVSNQVADIEGAYVPAGPIGTFTCSVSRVAYAAMMDTDPGWTMDPGWAFGKPTGTGGDPLSGYTGTNVVGYALTGRYSRSLSTRYATTPAFNCADASSVSVRFRRWLGVRNGDTARLEVSNDGSTWSSVWSASGAILDISWTAVQYDLSAVAAGHPAVRLRWAMGANTDTQVSFGWNIDDVQVYADGAVTDAESPVPLLSASDITTGGSPTHQFAVTYTDDTAVAVSSIGAGDVLVVEPGGATNLASFVGVDEPTDGTPRTASYALDAPGGLWDASDNGAYEVLLVYGEVRDTTGNEIAGGSLGSFQVNILPRWLLTVSNRPPEGGSVSPHGGEFVQGAPVELTAAPAVYYRFRNWTEDATGTNNPLVLAMASNLYVVANFEELLTTNYPTPLWWLASFGVTGDFETAVLQTGANGLALWQSYIAGLVPTNETSVLDVMGTVMDDGRTLLAWPTVSGRVYTVSVSTNLAEAFGPLPGAIRLPWTDNTRTAAAPAFFRIEVERE